MQILKQSKILGVLVLGLTLIVGIFTNSVSASTLNLEPVTVKTITVTPNTIYSAVVTQYAHFTHLYKGDIPETLYYNKNGWTGTLYMVGEPVYDKDEGSYDVTYTGTVYKNCVSACNIGSSEKVNE